MVIVTRHLHLQCYLTGKSDVALRACLDHEERETPDSTRITSLCNWTQGNKPLVQEEQKFLCDWNDLIGPRDPADTGGLHLLLERASYSVFGCGHDRRKSIDPNVRYTNVGKMTTITRWTTTVLAVATLIVPVVVLYKVGTVAKRLVAISAFTSVFSSMLAAFTQSRNYEIFAATAA
jgi:hypothetical protein